MRVNSKLHLTFLDFYQFGIPYWLIGWKIPLDTSLQGQGESGKIANIKANFVEERIRTTERKISSTLNYLKNVCKNFDKHQIVYLNPFLKVYITFLKVKSATTPDLTKPAE